MSVAATLRLRADRQRVIGNLAGPAVSALLVDVMNVGVLKSTNDTNPARSRRRLEAAAAVRGLRDGEEGVGEGHRCRVAHVDPAHRGERLHGVPPM